MRSLSKNMSFTGLVCLVMICMSAFMPSQSSEPNGDEPLVRITQIDTSQFPQVMLYVSVTDQAGEPVSVSASKLVIEENGVAITPDSIIGVGESGPLTTLLVIDISGSMNSLDKLVTAKEAAKAYVNQSRPNDLIGLLTYNTASEYVQPLTADQQALISAIEGLTAYDDTAMYDALLRGIEILSPITGRKAIIVLTDGMDNRSKATSADVIASIDPVGMSISTVGLGDPRHSEGNLRGLDEAALEELAENAGGAYGYADDAEGLKLLYERYGRALQSEYVLTYTSPARLRDGVNRSLQVSLSSDAGLSSMDTETSIYNPGGLVPEIPKPASWILFFSMLAGLILLLLLPAVLGKVTSITRQPQKGKIKLNDQRSRVKIRN